MDNLILSLEDNSVIVVISFRVNKEGRGEGSDARSVIVGPSDCTVHLGTGPHMLALGDMGVILGILVVVDDEVVAKFDYHISVEEYHIQSRILIEDN